MKKGFSTLEYVIAAVVIIAFAGIAIYAFTPKLQKAPGFIEGFLPEKCQESGLTRDQYLAKINAELMASTPNFENALKLRTAMRACFPDTDIHDDLKQHLAMQGIGKMDFSKLDDGTAKSLRKALDLYVESKGLVSPQDFKTIALLLFSRGIYHFKGYSAEGISLLDTIIERKGVSDEELAEAMALKALFLEREGKTSQASKLYGEVIDKFGKSTSKDVQLYAGLAFLRTNKPNESVPLLDEALDAKSAYNRDFVRQYLIQALYKTGDSATALMVIDRSFSRAGFAESIAYKDVFDAYFEAYARVPPANRTVKDCPLDTLLTDMCICKNPPAILPDETRKFCCSPNKSEKECVCAHLRRCSDYPDEKSCSSDICGFEGYSGSSHWYCVWENNACKTEYFSAGGELY